MIINPTQMLLTLQSLTLVFPHPTHLIIIHAGSPHLLDCKIPLHRIRMASTCLCQLTMKTVMCRSGFLPTPFSYHPHVTSYSLGRSFVDRSRSQSITPKTTITTCYRLQNILTATIRFRFRCLDRSLAPVKLCYT